MSVHNEPYHIFKSNVFAVAKALCPAMTPEWFDTQAARINLYWNCMESSITAGKTIADFANGHFSKTYIHCIKTPKQCAISFTEI